MRTEKSENNFSKNDTLIIKGIAIIFMIYHHCFLSSQRYEGQNVSFYPFSESFINNVALSMKLCVALFVFLSAYSLTLSLKDIDAANMIKSKIVHRYIRTMSGFYFVFILLNIFSLLTNKGWYTKVYGEGILSVLYFFIDGLGLAELFGTPQFIATFWYMSLAQLLIISVPLLLFIYRKYGVLTLYGVSLIISTFFVVDPLNHSYAFYPHYIICISTGIVSADKNLLVKSKLIGSSNYFLKTVKFILLLSCIPAFAYIRLVTRTTPLLGIWEAVISFLIIAFAFNYIAVIPILRGFLKLLGKYSMNIFLVHNFIRVAWYYDFTYSFKHFIIIGLVLLSISFVISYCIEQLKRITKYSKLIDNVERRLLS